MDSGTSGSLKRLRSLEMNVVDTIMYLINYRNGFIEYRVHILSFNLSLWKFKNLHAEFNRIFHVLLLLQRIDNSLYKHENVNTSERQ